MENYICFLNTYLLYYIHRQNLLIVKCGFENINVHFLTILVDSG
jgi:hypothetical protein